MFEIRAAAPEDAAAIANIYGPFVATNAVSFETEAPTTREMKARITSTIDHYPWLVAIDEESKVVLGYAYAKQFKPGNAYRFAVETAVYGAGELAGRGIKRQLLSTLVATLIEQNFTQAIVTLTTPNDQLIQLYESTGFRRAGAYREISYKGGQWLDVGLWQRELADAGSIPDEPRSFSSVGVVRG